MHLRTRDSTNTQVTAVSTLCSSTVNFYTVLLRDSTNTQSVVSIEQVSQYKDHLLVDMRWNNTGYGGQKKQTRDGRNGLVVQNHEQIACKREENQLPTRTPPRA